MSVYIAKYIIVGEEITVGDWIGYPNLKQWVPVQYLGGDLTGFEKKVELCLCSMNIKTGDKVIDPITGEQFHVKNWELHASENYLKVMGKISDDAIWVKEGNVFNADQVRKAVDIELYYADASEQWQYYTNYLSVENSYACKKEKGYEETILDERIEIKGSCGHFH